MTIAGSTQKSLKEQVVDLEKNKFKNSLFKITEVLVITVINDKTVDFIVLAKGLSAEGEYTISFKTQDQRGVTFGPKVNVDIKVGRIVGETQFKPNNQGVNGFDGKSFKDARRL
ncbi:hypothetical protein JOC77_003506 [Peribacillus deserti]|uniref:Bacterial Ig domain-containing protein n=1 Tax=Peribacillus deserti TaxID=673318 RepID=A0ABS2QLS2_9BACI|nr:hypothetical protein [Peribacillus deserti]